MTKSAGADFASDLDSELQGARTGACWYCTNVREAAPDVNAAVTAKLATYTREKPWSAIARVLVKHGFEGANKTKVSTHFLAADRAKHGLV